MSTCSDVYALAPVHHSHVDFPLSRGETGVVVAGGVLPLVDFRSKIYCVFIYEEKSYGRDEGDSHRGGTQGDI